VLNGIDYKEWDPETDTFIHKNYSHANITGKRGNKKALCKELRLLYTKDAPLLGTVTRLVEQKGVDIILSALPKIVKMGASFVLLGTGEKEFEKECMKVAKKYPKQVSVNIKYDNALAHRIYAGVDVFCMPSRFEPCGLGQMISLRYGTLPLVRCTGGLADTVKDIDEGGTGFVFHTPSADAFSDAVKRAITTYSNKRAWSVLVKKAMRQDFSWRRSATDYVRLYKAAIEAAS
jgi:starch synthase